MIPRPPAKRRRAVVQRPQPLPKRDADADLLDRPAPAPAFDEPARERVENGFDPNVNSIPR